MNYVRVSLYGPLGLLDRRAADNGQDAVRVIIEIAREWNTLSPGMRFEIERFRDVEIP